MLLQKDTVFHKELTNWKGFKPEDVSFMCHGRA